MVVFVIWAYFTTLDLVTIGTGRVVAAGQNIKIQAFESGSISLLEVQENDKVKKNDKVFNKAIIDEVSLKIIEGSIIDFKKELIGNSFIINNPKANSSCGCGLSFSV